MDVDDGRLTTLYSLPCGVQKATTTLHDDRP
jgi:hypothetical protein